MFKLLLGLMGVIIVLLIAIYLFLKIVRAFLREVEKECTIFYADGEEEIKRKYEQDTNHDRR